MRIVKDLESTLRFHVEDEAGNLIEPSAPPTVAVERSDGTSVAVGTPVELSTGVYGAVLSPYGEFDVLTAIWSADVSGNTRSQTDTYTIIKERLVPMRVLRADPKINALEPVPTDAQLIGLANQLEDWICRALKYPYCEQAFTRQFRVKKPTTDLLIPGVHYPKTITAVRHEDSDWETDDLDDLRVVRGAVERGQRGWSFLTGVPSGQGGWQPGVYTISGTHGGSDDWDGIPSDLGRAALSLARYVIRTNNWSERARQVQTQDAVITFSMPGPDRPTGLPEVDAVVTGYGLKSVL